MLNSIGTHDNDKHCNTNGADNRNNDNSTRRNTSSNSSNDNSTDSIRTTVAATRRRTGKRQLAAGSSVLSVPSAARFRFFFLPYRYTLRGAWDRVSGLLVSGYSVWGFQV